MHKYGTKIISICFSQFMCQKGLPKTGLGLEANGQGEMHEKTQWSGKDLV